MSKLKSQTVFLDTAPLIYFIEGGTAYQDNLKNFFAAFDSGDFTIITSTLTPLEVLLLPKQHAIPEMYLLDKPTPTEYPILLEIWEASVRATHHFLSEPHRTFYKQFIPENRVFHLVDITIIRNPDREILGFMGVADEKLEMIFLKPEVRGKRIGKMLLNYALEKLRINKVDVNEQNDSAVNFYKHLGFQKVAWSAFDGMRYSFPILHLQLL